MNEIDGHMISIVIPLKNETDVAQRLKKLEDDFPKSEIIVVDVSSMPSLEDTKAFRSRYLHSPDLRYRSEAMNRGAEIATGNVLIFLHFDCQLPLDADSDVQNCIHQGATGGAFVKRYDKPPHFLRLQGAYLNFVGRTFRRCLVGTNALYIRKDAFESWGGFPEVPLLEDVALADYLRKSRRCSVVKRHVRVSSRRYQKRLGIPTMAKNTLIYALYRLQVSPKRLYDFYGKFS